MLYRRIRYWLNSANRQTDLRAEMESHIEETAAQLVEQGFSESDARAEARRRFGGGLLKQEQAREVWIARCWSDAFQDLRYASRLLARNPALTITALLSLAIAIGMNTATFTLIDAVLLRELRVQQPEDLVLLAERAGSRQVFSFSSPAFRSLKDSDALTGLSAFRPWRVRTEINGQSQLADGQLVSGNYFSLMGIQAFLGRTLSEDDDRPGANAVVVLSYRYWQRQFGSDPGLIGRTLSLQGYPFTVVGVAAPEFFGFEPGKEIDVTLPLITQPVIMPGTPLLNSPNARWLRLVGHRKSGTSLEQVQANLALRWAQLALTDSRPPKTPESQFEVLPGGQGLYDLRSQFSLPLRVLMMIVGIVMLVACVNLASLLLARVTSRQREIAARLALGASRWRLVRQLLTESILLSLISCILGTAVAYWGTPWLVKIMSRGREPLILDLAMHTRTLFFSVIISVAAGVLFGIAPALRGTRTSGLYGTRSSSPGPGRWTAALIVSQVSLCLVVLTGAGLLLGSLRNLRQVDPGFRKDHVLLFSIRPALSNYNGPRGTQLYEDLYRRFSGLPGVLSVTLSMDTPLGGVSYTADASLPGASGRPAEALQVNVNSVGPRFFETMGIPLLAGRDLNRRDDSRAPLVAVITESVARSLFPDKSPLGEHVRIGQSSMEIIGIAKDTRYQSLREPPQPMVYRPYLQMPGTREELFYGLRTVAEPDKLLNVVTRELRAVAPNVPIFSVRTLEEQVDATLVQERVVSILSGWLGGFALLLSAIGIYGRLAYAVAERTPEIGIRVALGARGSVIMFQILREMLALVLCGVVLGIPLTLVSVKVIRSLLFGLSPSDPFTFTIVVVTIVGIAGLAAYIPARRASRVDPLIALRYE